MSRPIFSRPRTRVYGCNYDKGESYYKPMVDHLDRKYSGRPLFSEPRTSLADEIAARRSDIGKRESSGSPNIINHDNDLDLELFPRSKARLSFVDGEDDEMVYDIRGQKTKRRNLADDFASDVAASTSRFKNRVANIKFSGEPYDDLSSEILNQHQTKSSIIKDVIESKSNFKTTGIKTTLIDIKKDKEKDTGLNYSFKSILDDDDLDVNAAMRARKTKNRLLDLENEMEEMVKKQDKRERRAAAVQAFINENLDDMTIKKKF